MMSEESNITLPPEEGIKMDHWNKRMEKEMPISATNELGKHLSKKVITELLENFSKLRRNSATTEMNNIIDNTKEMKHFSHQYREITWINDKHHNSNIPKGRLQVKYDTRKLR